MKKLLFLLSIFLIVSCSEKKEATVEIADVSKEMGYYSTNDFEVVHNELGGGGVRNIDVLLKTSDKSESNLNKINEQIRAHYSTEKMNVDIFDNKEASEKSLTYPLEGADKKLVSNHLIATFSFEAPNTAWMYPLK